MKKEKEEKKKEETVKKEGRRYRVSYAVIRRVIRARNQEEAKMIFCQKLNLSTRFCFSRLKAKRLKKKAG